jgi:hypothetical protein
MALPATYTVTGERMEKIDLTISACELRYALFQAIYARTGIFDDAGCNWYTDDAGNTFVNERAWQVSSDPDVATLVDAASIILLGHPMKLEEEHGE